MSGEIRVNITGNAQGLQTAMNTVKTSANGAVNTMTKSIQKADSATQSWAEKIRGSRGLIYGMGAIIGTVTGVVFELETLQDAQAQVADSQEHLTELEKQGKQGTEEYSRAQQSLAKDARYLSLTMRNLALAFTNFIPEILMMVTMAAKAKVATNEAATSLTNFGKVTKIVKGETTIANTALAAQAGAFDVIFTGAGRVKKPMQDLRDVEMVVADATKTTTGRFGSFATMLGRGGPWMLAIAAAGAAFLAFIENWGGFRDAVNQAGVALGNFIPQLKFILDPIGKFGDLIAEKLGNKVPAATKAAGKGMQEMSKEAVKAAEDVQKAWEETLTNLEDMSRKDRLKHLTKDLGFGKKGARKIEFQIEVQEDRKQILDKMAEIMNIISHYKIDPKDQKVAVNNLIESLRDAMKDSKGQLDDLNPLLQILKDHKSDPDLPKYVAEWLGTLDSAAIGRMKLNGIDPVALITKLGIDPAKLSPAVQSALGITVKNALTNWDPTTGFGGGAGFNFGENEGAGGFIDKMLIQPIQKKLDEFHADPATFGKNLGNDIVAGFNTAGGLILQAAEFITPLLVATGTAVKTFFTQSLPPLMNQVFMAVGQTLTTIAHWLDPMLAATLNNMVTFFTIEIPNWIKTTFTVANVMKGLSTIKDMTSEFIKGFVALISNPGSMATGAGQWGAGVLQAIGDWISVNFPKTRAVLDNIWVNFENWIKGSVTIITDLAGKLVTDFLNWVGKKFTEAVTQYANIAGDFISGFNKAVTDKASEFAKVGENIFNQVKAGVETAYGGLTGIAKWFFDFLAGKGIIQEVGGAPGNGKTPVDNSPKVKDLPSGKVTLSNTDAIVAIDTLVKYWDSKSKTIAAIVPMLSANNRNAISVIDTVHEWWKRIGGDIQGLSPILPVNNKTAITNINAVYTQWKRIVGDIKGLTAVPKVNPKPAKDSLTSIYQWAKRIVGDINGLKASIKVTKETTEITHKKTVIDPNMLDPSFRGNNAYATHSGMNIIIVNTDDYDVQKKKKFRAELGRRTYRFG